jgi:predicted nucleic acid-binding protein
VSVSPLLAPVPPGTITFVLDANVPFRWCVPNVSDIYPVNVLKRMSSEVAAVPAHWSVQLADLLRVGVRAKRTTEANALRILTGFDVFDVRVDPCTADYIPGSTFALARAQKLTVFDAAYIELALRLGVPLATNDPNLTRVANAVGVPLFTP